MLTPQVSAVLARLQHCNHLLERRCLSQPSQLSKNILQLLSMHHTDHNISILKETPSIPIYRRMYLAGELGALSTARAPPHRRSLHLWSSNLTSPHPKKAKKTRKKCTCHYLGIPIRHSLATVPSRRMEITHAISIFADRADQVADPTAVLSSPRTKGKNSARSGRTRSSNHADRGGEARRAVRGHAAVVHG